MTLLDTHALIGYSSREDALLGPESRRLVDEALKEGAAGISAVTFWETAMLAKKGRIRLECDADAWRESVLRRGFKEFPLDGKTAILSVRLAVDTGDPFDRFIAAAALSANARLLTVDEALLKARDIPTMDARK